MKVGFEPTESDFNNWDLNNCYPKPPMDLLLALGHLWALNPFGKPRGVL